MREQRAAAYDTLPKPLDALLPPLPPPSLQQSAVAKSERSNRERLLGRKRRCGIKLWALLHIYGSGVLLLQYPVLRLSSLYECNAQSFDNLRAELPRRPLFANVMAVISAAYESTVLGIDNDPLKELRQ
jgi:hypothetical protein